MMGMHSPMDFCPQQPSWTVDWNAINERFDWIRALAGCPQNPEYHAEGDVWIHTRMVCEALAGTPVWRALPEPDRQVVFATALLHDVGKPQCTRVDVDGRITSAGHSRRGAILARRILWRLGVPFAVREAIVALVRHHQVPYYLVDRPDARRLAIEVSQTARCDHLALVAEADVRGRLCQDQQRLLDNVGLFAEFCRDEHCLATPRTFASDHARFLFFRNPHRHPDALAHDAFRSDVVVMSGLPGAGKDTWVRSNLPDWSMVSLDAVRSEMDIDPAGEQGQVISRAREQAREHLRDGRPFVWNATNLSRALRGQCIGLFADYHARIRIVYVEAPEERLHQQNHQRQRTVPQSVLDRLLDRWEVPDATESHSVRWEVT
jgi:putative nucleotidyltransferase with HDIG domain